MRKLKLETQLSIDGFIADVNGNTDWMIWNWGPDWTWDMELRQYHTQLTKSADTFLISRQMAEEGFNAHWKQAAQNPEDLRYEFAKHVTDSRKIVFTTTLDKTAPIPGDWVNTDVAEGNFREAINRMKKQKGSDMLVYGGASFVSSLIEAQLIDEFHLLINPVTIGDGLSIFKRSRRQNLKLVRMKSFDCGVALLHYELP